MKPEEIVKFCKEKGIQIVDLKFNDLPGLWQHFSIPATELTELEDANHGIWTDGIGFDGSSIRGFQAINESDMLLMPDPIHGGGRSCLRGADAVHYLRHL